MRKFFLSMLVLVFIPCLSNADNDPGSYKKAEAVYRIYAGSLGDPIAPTRKEKKIAFSIKGQAARALFDAIGPDRHDECTAGSGNRVRYRDGEKVLCSRAREGEYVCSFGFDLQTGKSIGGSLC